MKLAVSFLCSFLFFYSGIKAQPGNGSQLILLLDENFESNINKWAVWDNENNSASIINGSYRITQKQNNSLASWLGFPALAADQSKDFTIETKIFLHSTETGNAYDSYWLTWGVGNSGKDYYTFGIFPTGQFNYGKMVNNAWVNISGSVSSPAIKTGIGTANVLRLEKRKDSVLFYVNGINVYNARYEIFEKTFTGVGYLWVSKKMLDVEYLRVYQGTVSNYTLSPEPYETNYQQKLINAANSDDRANAIIDYYLSIKQMNFTTEQMETLLGQKFLQMMEIDFHGYYLTLMSKRLNADDIKLCMKAGQVLTKEQRDAIQTIAKYTVDEFVATQNNAAKPAYPIGVPQPGYGWGKTVSSNKPGLATNKPVTSLSKSTNPIVTEAQLQQVVGKFFEGKTKVYNSDFVMKIVSYRERGYGAGYDVNVRIAKKSSVNQMSCNVENKTVDAESLFYPTDTYYTAHDPYEICKACNGTGFVTQKTSHTNDYEYTLGKKTTYTSTSKVACIACAPGKNRPMKVLAACIENNSY